MCVCILKQFRTGVGKLWFVNPIWPTVYFCKLNFNRTQSCLFTYVLPMVTYALKSRVEELQGDQIWPAKHKVFTI